MRNEFCVILILLFGIISVQAIPIQAQELQSNDYGVWQHQIDIVIGLDGTAEVTERFNLYFNSEQGKIGFREKSLELGSDLKLWDEFDKQFSPTLGQNNIVNGKITYSESENNYLELKYKLVGALMTKGKETSFIEEYSIKATYLNNLFQSGLWIIPDNTIISIELPPGAEINEAVAPDATIQTVGTKKVIVWEGYKSANQLKVKYVLWKKISPIVDLNKVSDFLFRTTEGLFLVGIIILFFGIVIWKRKLFINKIESFVENNTIFEEDD